MFGLIRTLTPGRSGTSNNTTLLSTFFAIVVLSLDSGVSTVGVATNGLAAFGAFGVEPCSSVEYSELSVMRENYHSN